GRFRLRLVLGITEQFEHPGDMLLVGLAKLLRMLVFLEVVFALRQAQAALERASDHPGAVLGILMRAEAKERTHPSRLQPLRLRLEVPDRLDFSNPRHF